MKNLMSSYARTWAQHTGIQFATLSILSATLTVVAIVFVTSFNVNRIMTQWGTDIKLTAYLEDDKDLDFALLEKKIQGMDSVKAVEFVGKERALQIFNNQLKDITPEFLNEDLDANPLPNSFEITLKEQIKNSESYEVLTKQASLISGFEGIEDVSYGQSWLKNYSAFVSGVTTSGVVVILILLVGSLFIIGNSIRSSISSRKEEIEILELVGATRFSIRLPFVFEGFVTGALTSAIGLFICFFLFSWAKAIISQSAVLARLSETMQFFDYSFIFLFVLGGALIGGLGSFLTVRGINDGWSASQGAN